MKIFFIISILFALLLLTACGRKNSLHDWLTNAQRIHPSESEILRQWLTANQLDPKQLTAAETGSSAAIQGRYDVLVDNRLIRELKAKNIRSLSSLDQLSALQSISFDQVKFNQLTGCPGSLLKLRITGSALKSLEGIESCQNLTHVELIRTSLTQISTVLALPKIERIKIVYGSLSEITIGQTVPNLKHMDLSNNKIHKFVTNALMPALTSIDLAENQIRTFSAKDHLTALSSLDLSDNKLSSLHEIQPITSLEKLDLRQNPLTDLSPLLNWPNLNKIYFKGQNEGVPDKLAQSLEANDIPLSPQSIEALALKKRYLANSTFIKELPSQDGGQSLGVHKDIASHFSLNGPSHIIGSIEIDELNGLMRLPVAQVDDLKFYDKNISVQGQASVQSGHLNIYNPVDINFWTMARLFVDTPEKNKPDNYETLQLKGFSVYTVEPGGTKQFQANLLPFGSRYLLLIGAEQGETSGIKLTLYK